MRPSLKSARGCVHVVGGKRVASGGGAAAALPPPRALDFAAGASSVCEGYDDVNAYFDDNDDDPVDPLAFDALDDPDDDDDCD